MDLHDYWQENKRFVTGALVGAVAFLIALLVVRSSFSDELRAARASRTRLERELGEARFDAGDREVARSENDALRATLGRLAGEVEFRPRPAFRLDGGAGSPVNQYHRTVASVRERLLADAGRADLVLDAGLGLPDLSPANEEEIERYLAALDAIERTVLLALELGVARVDDVRIRLDPALASKKGVGDVERTRIELELAGAGDVLAELLVATQRRSPDAGGERPLTVEAFELSSSTGRVREGRLSLTLSLVRLHQLPEEDPS